MKLKDVGLKTLLLAAMGLLILSSAPFSHADCIIAMGSAPPQEQLTWSRWYPIFQDYSGGVHYMRYLTDGSNLYGYREADSLFPEAYCNGGVECLGTQNGRRFYQCHPYER